MPVTDVNKDPEALTLTITAEFDAPPKRAWELWSDPRQLERWWGPPGYPATVTTHEFAAGGDVRYFMTSPEGDKYPAWWKIIELDEPRALRFEEGFSGDDGEPNRDMPVSVMTVSLSERSGGGTQMSILTQFSSAEAMQQMMDMGMEEGMRLAVAQIDDILAA